MVHAAAVRRRWLIGLLAVLPLITCSVALPAAAVVPLSIPAAASAPVQRAAPALDVAVVVDGLDLPGTSPRPRTGRCCSTSGPAD
jgi:hypothetical protein